MTKEEDVVKETLYILNYFNSNFVAKIPNNFLEKLKKIAKTSKINVNIDKSKKLEEQKISEDCKDLISLIYYNYVASKEEKKEILDNWIKNEKKYQNELNEKYNANDIFKNINNKKNKEIILENLPFYIKPIVKSKIKNTLGGRLRVFIVGAAAANPQILADIQSFGLNVLQGYGLTECSPLVAGNTDFYQKDDAAGLPIPNVEYKINNPNDEGVGEIIVKGPNVMLGYYNMEDETNKVLVDGWFHTGDLGKIDENGYLYITGRCKSVIVTKNGKNIYPEEVEHYLNDSPLIAESLVQGIHKENDDETYVNAQIFPNIEAITEYLKGTVPTKAEIKKIISDVISNVNKKMPTYKHIKNFVIRDKEFEKTTTKKIKRYGNNLKND